MQNGRAFVGANLIWQILYAESRGDRRMKEDVNVEFRSPDFAAPLDVDEAIRAAPAEATVKGMFLQAALDDVRAAGLTLPTTESYKPFKDYPVTEFCRVLADCARLLHPDVPLREAMRRMGRRAFPTFKETLLGRVLFGVLGNHLTAVLRSSARWLELSQSHGRLVVQDIDDGHAVLKFSNVYTFLDSYHVGLIEGTMAACQARGTVEVHLDSPWAGELLVRWVPKNA